MILFPTTPIVTLLTSLFLPSLCTTLTLPLLNDHSHQRYTLNLTAGTPPQLLTVLLDTASTDLWFPLPNSSGCTTSCPENFFRPELSTSLEKTEYPFNISYGFTPDLQVIGALFNDTLSFTSTSGRDTVKLEDVTFGVADVPKILFRGNIWGILGLGSRYGEAHFVNPGSPYWRNESALYVPVWERLAGKTKVVGVWLNSGLAWGGEVSFGAESEVEEGQKRKKYTGELKAVPVSLRGPNARFEEWAVNLTSITRIDNDGKEQLLTPSGTPLEVIPDTGSPNIYLPPAIVQGMTAGLNVTIHSPSPGENFLYVACSLRSSNTSYIFDFPGREGSQGPKIKVPLGDVIYRFGDPENIGEVRDSNGKELCYLGLNAIEGPIRLLGATMLRSAYAEFDADNFEIRMAQANWDEDWRPKELRS